MTEPNRIHVLPDALVDMIAAGEVVERPASIVKELVENSLDAGATRIDVSIRRGGTEEIRVFDDGCGMTPADLKLALLRHATSKISGMEDLERIATYGFRGEALPSMASVSRMTVMSRTPEMDMAMGYAMEAQKILDERVEGQAPGTRIVIRDLFFNVPARLKFLKKEATEASHVQDVVTNMALSAPGVHFRLTMDDRLSLEFLPQPDIVKRASDVLARRVRTGLYPHQEKGPEGILVQALVSPPEVHLAEASGVYLFVNRRPIRDRMLLRCVTGAYGGLLPRGRYPVMVLFLELPPTEVDVNVHPQKTEVRFRNERLIAAFVRSSLQRALESVPAASAGTVRSYELASAPAQVAGETETGDPGKKNAGNVRAAVAQALSKLGNRPSAPKPSASSPKSAASSSKPAASSPKPAAAPQSKAGALPPGPVASPSSLAARNRLQSLFDTTGPAPGASSPVSDAMPPESTEAPEPGAVRYLGCHAGLYLLFSRGSGLVIMDMHAASERVRYHEILQNMQKSRVKTQGLLIPLNMEVPRGVLEMTEDLVRLGFDLEPFGESHLVIRGVPTMLGTRPVEPLLSELFDELETGRSPKEGLPLMERLAATCACHSALRHGDPVSPASALELYHTVSRIPLGGYCPHGRPVMFEWTTGELETRFHRR